MLEFYKAHEPVWTENALAIGLTAAQTTAIAGLIDAAVTAQANAVAARQNSAALTESLNQLAAEVRSYGASLMATIRAYAENTKNPDVYVKAEIPAPKPPQPAPPPAPPTELTADPNAVGTITLKWKGTIAMGQMYRIERSIDGGAFVNLGAFAVKTWTDEAVPMNTNIITYRVYGQRGLEKSTNAATAVVNFGNLPAELAAAFRTSGGEGLAEAA